MPVCFWRIGAAPVSQLMAEDSEQDLFEGNKGAVLAPNQPASGMPKVENMFVFNQLMEREYYMNTKKKWLRTLVCAFALIAWLAAPSLAHAQMKHGEDQQEGEHHEGGHESKADIPKHADEIVAEIFAQDLLVQNLIETGSLTGIHRPASRAKDLAQALEGKAHGLKPEDQEKLVAAIGRIVSTAKELDEYGDAKDAAKTGIAYKSFDVAIKDIKSLYPDITPSHYWTCSMHPDLWKTESGQCPKCDHEMTLIMKHYEGQAEHHEDANGHD